MRYKLKDGLIYDTELEKTLNPKEVEKRLNLLEDYRTRIFIAGKNEV